MYHSKVGAFWEVTYAETTNSIFNSSSGASNQERWNSFISKIFERLIWHDFELCIIQNEWFKFGGW